jgi:hypothetical protein
MSIMLKLLALMALVVATFTPAYAGMCNKNHPNWDPATKKCPEKTVVLKEREPTPPAPPAPEPERRTTEVVIPPPVVAKALKPPQCGVVSNTTFTGSAPTYVQLNALTVAGPCGFVFMPGGGYTVPGSTIKTVMYTPVCVD